MSKHVLIIGAGPAGVFAAGDVTGEPYQLARAVGQGNSRCRRSISL